MNKELTPLSFVAYGVHSEHILKERFPSDAQNVVSRFSTGKHVTGFSGRYAPLRIQFLCHPLGATPLPWEGGSCSSSCSNGDTEAGPVTLTIYSSPKAIPKPSGQRPVKPKNPLAKGRSNFRTFSCSLNLLNPLFHNPSTQPAAPATPLHARRAQANLSLNASRFLLSPGQ